MPIHESLAHFRFDMPETQPAGLNCWEQQRGFSFKKRIQIRLAKTEPSLNIILFNGFFFQFGKCEQNFVDNLQIAKSLFRAMV